MRSIVTLAAALGPPNPPSVGGDHHKGMLTPAEKLRLMSLRHARLIKPSGTSYCVGCDRRISANKTHCLACATKGGGQQ